MKSEWTRKWVAALRSGKYEQTKGRLRTSSGFCCLGVLCDIMPVGEWQRESEYGKYEYVYKPAPDMQSHLDMTLSIDMARLVHPKLYSEQTGLANMNDNGASFEVIADYIENLPDGP